MKKIYVTKKYRTMLDRLGYNGNEKPSYDEVAEWLMTQNYYVMPLPQPYRKWEVGIVILGKPNTKDMLLNRCTVAESLKSIEEAVRTGVEFVLKSLYDAKKIADKRYNDSEFIENEKRKLREEGFDV